MAFVLFYTPFLSTFDELLLESNGLDEISLLITFLEGEATAAFAACVIAPR